MGALTSSCQSEEAREQLAKNKAIEKQINQDRRAGTSIIKLLLLGKFYNNYFFFNQKFLTRKYPSQSKSENLIHKSSPIIQKI